MNGPALVNLLEVVQVGPTHDLRYQAPFIMGIREVAQLASVSTATVSRVITGSAKVTPETTERVLRAVKALDFQPDESARALAFQKKIKLDTARHQSGYRLVIKHSPKASQRRPPAP